MSENKLPPLSNLEALIDGAGQITIGAIEPVPCAAVASYGRRPVAILVRRDGEPIEQLLGRLDKAVNLAHEAEDFVDEINHGPDARL